LNWGNGYIEVIQWSAFTFDIKKTGGMGPSPCFGTEMTWTFIKLKGYLYSTYKGYKCNGRSGKK